MKNLRLILVLLRCYTFGHTQDISEIGKQKPLVLRGSIGASGNFYQSNEPLSSRPPWSWNLYGNLTATVYGIAVPVSFVVNQYGHNVSKPFSQFGLSPQYKWVKLHLGVRSIAMSPLVFYSQSFRGAGLELTPSNLRFAAFYGKLNRKVSEDTTGGRYVNPQFSRIGYGARLGYGTEKNFLDLIWFHARDESRSLPASDKQPLPMENTVVGTSFRVTPVKQISMRVDFSVSGLTKDLRDSTSSPDSSDALSSLMAKLLDWKSSTGANYAGQVNLQANLKNYNGTLGYRRVQPEFKSLGTPYMIDDTELINWMNIFNLNEGKASLTLSLSSQHNNLKKNLPSQMNIGVGTFNLNVMATPNVNLNTTYTGYQLQQKDGTLQLTDSVRLRQQIHNIGFTPSYMVSGEKYAHSLSGNINLMVLNDRNPVTDPYSSSSNLSGSATYTFGILKKMLNLSLGGLFSNYRQRENRYDSYGVNLGSNAQFLEKKNLSTQLSAGYIFNKSNMGDAQSNITFNLSVGYSENRHSFNLFSYYVYTPYNPINEVIQKAMRQIVASKTLTGGISYNYSF